MKKKTPAKLHLSRETLRRLEPRELRPALGGTMKADDPPTETCWCVTYDPCLEK